MVRRLELRAAVGLASRMPSPSTVLLLLSFGGLAAFANVPQDPSRDGPLLQKAKELAATGPEHALLAQLAGDWDVVFTTHATGSEAKEERGRASGSLLLGGRYVQVQFRMQSGQVPVQAIQLFGFDTLRQLFTSSWRDDLSTWSVECSGPRPAAGSEPGVIELQGTACDVHDPTGRPFRMRVQIEPATVAIELRDTLDGREHLVQRQRWTRR